MDASVGPVGSYHTRVHLAWLDGVNPVVERILPEMEAGEYAAALRDIETYTEFMARHGTHPFGPRRYFDEELECRFNLCEYDKVIAMWRQSPYGRLSSLAAVGISMLREGQTPSPDMAPDKALVRWIAALPEDKAQAARMLPGTSNPREMERRLRLLRGEE